MHPEESPVSPQERELRRRLDPSPHQVRALVREAMSPTPQAGRLAPALAGAALLGLVLLAGVVAVRGGFPFGQVETASRLSPQPPLILANQGSVVTLTTADGQVQALVAQGEKP